MSILTAPLKAVVYVQGQLSPLVIPDVQRAFKKDGYWTVEADKETIFFDGGNLVMVQLTEQR